MALLNRIYYRPKLKSFVRKLRNNPTKGELKLWKFLRKKQLVVDFNRQKPLLGYIVDFYCISLKLAIEIDGASHDENKFDYDVRRQRELESQGITFLRFSEYDVVHRTFEVLETVSECINTLLLPLGKRE